KSGAREESQNQVFHGAAPLTLATVSVDVVDARNNSPPIAQNVRFGSKAEKLKINTCPLHPRKRTSRACSDMSAKCQSGLMHRSKVAALLDHLVGACEQRRHIPAEVF